MITGGSNFPVYRAEKANRAEERAYENFINWRDKYFKAVNRVKTLSPEDELEKAMKQLDFDIILNEKIKEINKSIRAFKKNKIDYPELLKKQKEIGLDSPEWIKTITYTLNCSYCNGIRTLATKIKRDREKLLVMKNRIERKKNWEDVKFSNGYITIEDDRVKIFHDSKPEREVIDKLKHSGFRWSRNWGCWSRKHTGAAIERAKEICCETTN